MLKYFLLAILIVTVDRYTKGWAINHLEAFQPMMINPFFNLSLTFNTGAAFSFLHSASGWQNAAFTILALIVSLLIVYWLATLRGSERWLSFALALILGGALGNAWDRFVYGFVIDFLDFHYGDWHFATFNIADSAITIGALMLIWHWLRR